MKKNIVFRVDSSFNLGSGHIVRCLTLAAGLIKSQKVEITFITRNDEGNFNHLIEAVSEIKICQIANDTQDDIAATKAIIQELPPTDLLIVDHYQLDLEWEKALSAFTKKILVIDDLYNREHQCDFLLDQNILTSTNPYLNLVKNPCTFFLGPKFALLREQFAQQKKSIQPLKEINNLLLFFGGSDAENETIKALIAMNLQKIRCIVPNNSKVKDFIKAFDERDNIEFLYNVKEMAMLLAATDLYVGAGGSITWERFCMGTTGLVTAIAPNQMEIAEQLDTLKYHYYLGSSKEVTVTTYIKTISEIMTNMDEFNSYREKAFNLVDGRGVEKIVEAIL